MVDAARLTSPGRHSRHSCGVAPTCTRSGGQSARSAAGASRRPGILLIPPNHESYQAGGRYPLVANPNLQPPLQPQTHIAMDFMLSKVGVVPYQ